MADDSSSSSLVPQTQGPTVVSPYTLSSSDNPGAVISSVLLNETNYNEWSHEMLNALQAKRKTGFINGSIPKPPDTSSDLENWKTVNSMIVGWIRSSIEPKLKSTVTFITDAHELWDELTHRFSVGNNVRVHQIKTRLASCRQDGQAVVEYYGRLCKLWDELKSYRSNPVCSCGATLSVIVKERDEEKLHQFLMGLDDARFGGLCTTLIGMDPLPSIAAAYSKVVREEQRLASARLREQKNEAVGFLARHDPQDQSSAKSDSVLGKGRVSCAHCGRSGHEQKDCWQIVGFPDWWVERSERGSSSGRGSGSRGKGGRGSSGGRGSGPIVSAHATSSNSSVFPEFSADQIRVLTQMIQEKSGSTGSDTM